MVEARKKFQKRERKKCKQKKKKKRCSHSSFLTCSHLSCLRAKKRMERIFFPTSRIHYIINRNTDGKMLCGSIYRMYVCVCVCVCKYRLCLWPRIKNKKSSPTALPTRFLLENVNIYREGFRVSVAPTMSNFPMGACVPSHLSGDPLLSSKYRRGEIPSRSTFETRPTVGYVSFKRGREWG